MIAMARRHDRGLRVFGEHEIALRPFPHQPREFLRQRVVDFLEHFARGRERIGQRLAHADRLAALSGKNECASHGTVKKTKGRDEFKGARITRRSTGKPRSHSIHLNYVMAAGVRATQLAAQECGWPAGVGTPTASSREIGAAGRDTGYGPHSGRAMTSSYERIGLRSIRVNFSSARARPAKVKVRPMATTRIAATIKRGGKNAKSCGIAARVLLQPAHDVGTEEAAGVADRIDQRDAARRRRAAEKRCRQRPEHGERRIDSARRNRQRDRAQPACECNSAAPASPAAPSSAAAAMCQTRSPRASLEMPQSTITTDADEIGHRDDEAGFEIRESHLLDHLRQPEIEPIEPEHDAEIREW